MILDSLTGINFTVSNIISLVPSQTELLYHLGLEEKVCGITKFCVHPSAWKKTKTIVGGTKQVNYDAIKKLSPDLIIANKEENEKAQIEELAKEYNIWVTNVVDLESALQMIKDIGVITGTGAAAEKLTQQIETSSQDFHPLMKKLRTCYLIWQKPFMTVGGDTFIHDMLSKCGFENIYSHKTRYPILEIKELADNNCELLILSSEPYPFKPKHVFELQRQLPGTKIILADGEMFSWYGSRLLKAASYFEALLASINDDLKHN